MRVANPRKGEIRLDLDNGAGGETLTADEAEKLISKIQDSIRSAERCWARCPVPLANPHGGEQRTLFCDRYEDHSEDRSDKRHSATTGSYGVEVRFRWEDPKP